MAGKKAAAAPGTELERQLADGDARIEELQMRLDVARVTVDVADVADVAILFWTVS